MYVTSAKYIIVITACPNEDQADKLASALIEQKLAACVQASAIKSTYHWNGKTERENEVRLLIKAKYSDYADIEILIKATLTYKNPEVLAYPVIAGSQIYLDWISAETK
jgi:periplasmic divalent cation tolerance protein